MKSSYKLKIIIPIKLVELKLDVWRHFALLGFITQEFWTSTELLKSEIIQRSSSVQEITHINATVNKKMNLKDIKWSLDISSVVLHLSLWFRLNRFFRVVFFLVESKKEQKKLTRETIKCKLGVSSMMQFTFFAVKTFLEKHRFCWKSGVNN